MKNKSKPRCKRLQRRRNSSTIMVKILPQVALRGKALSANRPQIPRVLHPQVLPKHYWSLQLVETKEARIVALKILANKAILSLLHLL